MFGTFLTCVVHMFRSFCVLFQSNNKLFPSAYLNVKAWVQQSCFFFGCVMDFLSPSCDDFLLPLFLMSYESVACLRQVATSQLPATFLCLSVTFGTTH